MERDTQILKCWKQVLFESNVNAFEALFRLTNANFIKFCQQYISDRETSEEIVSDVFVDLWLNRSKLEHVKKPEVYLLICVKNKALNHWKKKSSMQLVSLDEETNEIIDAYRPDEELERKELFMQLDRAIGSLPHQCRVIFKLVKEDGMKCAEVAEILNISVRTVHAQIYRAMTKLNTVMTKHQASDAAIIIKNIASAIALFLFLQSSCF
ncbi:MULTISPECIES: RNA polymerase sigma-70 factor [Olivibacter]|uniref:RNA polymerase sigma-70 factor n=2 Tax=Olivibacter TaxID=376469 RepID=A0ABV6HR49_9SPHI|nr:MULTISPECIES: RNA polymerase sigma-70 factor [Olivibacter]MCL4638660.1 RNA polymerase sigma-70 factor [Olivibacter sp. UJ_SKK_5.1]MDM8174308.1 RNA polymerase sigma-70 factor [Olivibacter sp. 47]MDX3916773.1 RNA polymerase sigma-70 factor [Pseudosphingobacterium sp.]